MQKSTFREDLGRAVAFHGHLCGGQIIGTRIARYALEYFGAYSSDERPDLVAYVEADRCLADAITSVSGLTMGKRRLKWMDYGKMAATFYNVETGEAIRIHVAEIRPSDEVEDIVGFYESYSDDEFLIVEPVTVNIRKGDLPGKPVDSVECESCGEYVHDGREVVRDGHIYCKACAGEDVYYKKSSAEV